MDEGVILIITFVIAISVIIIMALYYYNKQKMEMIKNGIYVSVLNSSSDKKLPQILFIVGMFSLGIALTGITGIVVESIINSMYGNWDLSQGPPPLNKDIGYQVGFFLYTGLSFLYSFFKIRKWNIESKN